MEPFSLIANVTTDILSVLSFTRCLLQSFYNGLNIMGPLDFVLDMDSTGLIMRVNHSARSGGK